MAKYKSLKEEIAYSRKLFTKLANKNTGGVTPIIKGMLKAHLDRCKQL